MVYEGHKMGMSETTFDKVVSHLLHFEVSSASCVASLIYWYIMYLL